MGSEDLDKLLSCLDDPASYPRAVVGVHIPDHSARTLIAQLDTRSECLFVEDEKPTVHFLELDRLGQEYHHSRISDSSTLRTHLTKSVDGLKPDPCQRLMFIRARHSRAPLKTTRDMLLQVLTYHQIMPAFLYFIFPFGKQHYTRDFHFTGFRSNSFFTTPCEGQHIPQLGRSGIQVEMCYSVKSVERDDQSQAWSIRQCSVHHKYDLQKERMTWIVVKANNLIQEAIIQLARREAVLPQNQQQQKGQTFAAALAIHKVLASWAGENWHLYINDLEMSIQDKTRRPLFIPLESTVPGLRNGSEYPEITKPAQRNRRNRSWTLQSITRHFTRSDTNTTWRTGEDTLSEGGPYELQAVEPSPLSPEVSTAVDDFSFTDLQDLQYFEDKANEALLVLKSNASVLKDMASEYVCLESNNGVFASCMPERKVEILQFDIYLQNVGRDLTLQQSRLETLLKLAADRKALLQGILQFRNMQATTQLALRAQESTENMEDMTRDMHIIAKKTKVETISMRIITIVTMVFLPGTFISTLMSTPIVDFDSNSNASGFSLQNIGVGALKLYLAASLPLLFLTLLAYYAYHRWERYTDALERRKNTHRTMGEV